MVSQYKNDVTVRDLVSDAIHTYSLKHLEPFYCESEEIAKETAMRDQHQFLVKRVISYRGDSTKRTEMYFTLEFEDGDVRELPWSPDIQCEAYYNFCKKYAYLFHLTLDTSLAKKHRTLLNKENITEVDIGDVVFLDLRFFGDYWYESLGLPDWPTTSYVMKFTYTHWFHRTSHKKNQWTRGIDWRDIWFGPLFSLRLGLHQDFCPGSYGAS